MRGSRVELGGQLGERIEDGLQARRHRVPGLHGGVGLLQPGKTGFVKVHAEEGEIQVREGVHNLFLGLGLELRLELFVLKGFADIIKRKCLRQRLAQLVHRIGRYAVGGNGQRLQVHIAEGIDDFFPGHFGQLLKMALYLLVIDPVAVKFEMLEYRPLLIQGVDIVVAHALADASQAVGKRPGHVDQACDRRMQQRLHLIGYLRAQAFRAQGKGVIAAGVMP